MGKDREEAAKFLKSYSFLHDFILSLVERPLYAFHSFYSYSSSEALETLGAQAVLSEGRLQLIVESLLTRNSGKLTEVVDVLFSQPELYTGVLETHLISFYVTLLRKSFSEHLVWNSLVSGSYLVEDSRQNLA